MADRDYRTLDTRFWSDAFVLDLPPDEKLFFIYILTNARVNVCGCYDLPRRVISFETGYDMPTVERMLDTFEQYGKIRCCRETNELLIVNWKKHNSGYFKSDTTRKAIEKKALRIKSPELKAIVDMWLSPADTPYIPHPYLMDTTATATATITEKEESSSSSPLEEMPTKTPSPPEQKAERMTIVDLRFLHHESFGTNMPGGCAEIATVLCQEFTADAIREAFNAAAVHGKPTMAYVRGVLKGNGKGKQARASPVGPVSFEQAKSERTKRAAQAFVERKRAECQTTTTSFSGQSSPALPRHLEPNAVSSE